MECKSELVNSGKFIQTTLSKLRTRFSNFLEYDIDALLSDRFDDYGLYRGYIYAKKNYKTK